jgi:hypothetical protein
MSLWVRCPWWCCSQIGLHSFVNSAGSEATQSYPIITPDFARLVDVANDGRPDLDRYVVLEVDGPGVSTSNVDVPAFLELAAAFFTLLKANANESATPLGFTSVKIEDKCVALCALPDSIDIAKDSADQALRQIAGEDAPHGLATLAERARIAVRRLPTGQSAKVIVGPWVRPVVVAPGEPVAPLDSMLSIRARPIRVGGKKPAVRFSSEMEEDFTLTATADQARELGSMLYRDVEIVARVSRDAAGFIEGGRLESFEIVEDEDPRPAWRDWFRKVRGTERA